MLRSSFTTGGIMPAHASDCRCQVPPPEAKAFQPTIEALADAMRANRHNATEEVLAALGFPVTFQHRYRDQAVVLARRASVDQVGDSSEDDDTMVARMRVALGELLPSVQFIVTELQCRGFTKRQMDRHLRHVINLASRDFASIGHPSEVH
jgi:hypothetical protein